MPTRDWLSSQSLGTPCTLWPRHTHTHPTHAYTVLLDLRPPSFIQCIYTYGLLYTDSHPHLSIYSHIKSDTNPYPTHGHRSPHPPHRSTLHTELTRVRRDPSVRLSGSWLGSVGPAEPALAPCPSSPACQSTTAGRKGTRSLPRPSAWEQRSPPEAAANSTSGQAQGAGGLPRAAWGAA